MTSSMKSMTVLAPEKESQLALTPLRKDRHFRIIAQARPRSLETAKNLLIAISASGLSEVADIVKHTNEAKLLRVLLVREDVPAEWLPQMLSRADLRMVRNLFVHGNNDWRSPLRIIRAWQMGAQRDLIARAHVVGDSLLVVDCALESFQVPFDSLPALRAIPEANRCDFNISESGSYIHWDAGDVHLDIDSLRYATDAEWRAKRDRELITHNKNIGRAISAIRKKHKLDKTDIAGVSDRQLRRIENEGARPGIDTLTALAKAHRMSVNSYLNDLASQIAKYH